MLQAIDERLSIWGWQTGTGARFAVVVDAWGKEGLRGGEAAARGGGMKGSGRGVGDSDVRAVRSLMRLFTQRKMADKTSTGIQGIADRIYTAVAKPFLRTG